MTTQTTKPRVLVLGASGQAGRELVPVLAAAHDVTAFDRGGNAAYDGPVRRARGSVLNAEDVDRAVAGQDSVVWAVGGHDAIRSLLSRKPRQARVCEGGTANVIAAMRAHGVRRLVVISSWGVGDGRRRLPFPFRFVLPLVMGAELRDKQAQERLVAASDLQWTILRPAILADGSSGRPLRVAEKQTFRASSRVPRGDLARLVAELLMSERAIGQTLEVSN